MPHPSWVNFDFSALKHNLERVRHYCPNSKILAMVKANAYGHGLLPCVQALSNADAYGVEDITTAIFLREMGITARILLMPGVFAAQEYDAASQYQLDVVIHDVSQIAMLAERHLTKPITVWMKIDTGMHRLGFLPEEVPASVEFLKQQQQVNWPPIWMTHFADAAYLDRDTTSQQIACFDAVVANYPGERSLANSAGIVGWSSSHADWVRPGVMLYGGSPIAGASAASFGLRPVMSLCSQLMGIKKVPAGDKIGYGGRYVCPRPMLIGIIPVGYGDGYPRTAQDGTPVWINGHIAPLVGNVSMDRITVDLTDYPAAKVGDPVECWGANLAIDEVAEAAGTISYELMCKITDRVRPDCFQIDHDFSWTETGVGRAKTRVYNT